MSLDKGVSEWVFESRNMHNMGGKAKCHGVAGAAGGNDDGNETNTHSTSGEEGEDCHSIHMASGGDDDHEAGSRHVSHCERQVRVLLYHISHSTFCKAIV